jgi:tetratricopeptide (TPR) repeat protein
MRRHSTLVAPLWLACASGAFAQNPAQAPPDLERQCKQWNDRAQAGEAAKCYETLLSANADAALRARALLGSARNELWSGNWRRSAGFYEQFVRDVAVSDASRREAAIEYIQLLRYKGNYARAEKLANELLERDPYDAAVLALRAEVLYWAGHRAHQALRDATRATEIDPNLASARVARMAALEALGRTAAAVAEGDSDAVKAASTPGSMASWLARKLNEKTRLRSDPFFSAYNDSDGIHDTRYGSAVTIPVRMDHSLGLRIGEAVSSAPMGVFTDGRNRASMREFMAEASALLAPGMRLSLSAGGSEIGRGALAPAYEAELSGSPRDRCEVTTRVAREHLAVTPRAIDQQVYSDGASVRVAYWFDARSSASFAMGERFWSDANRSHEGEAAFTRNLIYGKRFNLDTGALTGHQAFRRDMLAVSGFFTPDHYSRYAGFLATHGEVKDRVIWEFRGEGGAQQITTASGFEPNWAVAARLSARLNRSFWLYGSYERKNYSLVARDGWYQGFYASIAFWRIKRP